MRFLFFLLLFNILFAADKLQNKPLTELFEKKYYTYICLHRWVYINKYKDEKLLSLVAYACLKKHYLTPALDLAKVLRFTKIGRANATYLTTLFLIKNLIERYIKDNFAVDSFVFPKIKGSLLAKVFYLLQSQKPLVKGNTFSVKEKDNRYEVTFSEKTNTIIIKTFKNDVFFKKDRYW
jgi:hypothetical protein